MEFKNTIQSLQNLGRDVVKEGRSILKKRKRLLAEIHYIMTLII